MKKLINLSKKGKLMWNKVADADRYVVYRKHDGGKNVSRCSPWITTMTYAWVP